MDLKFDAMEWRLFMDSSSRNLKAVPLNDGNSFSSIPIGHSVQMKETQNSTDHLLSVVNPQEYIWWICGSFKVVGIVLGLQREYTKYRCFLCLWDIRANDQHYVRQECLLRQGLKPVSHNAQSHFLVEPNKILLLPLYIKFRNQRIGKAVGLRSSRSSHG